MLSLPGGGGGGGEETWEGLVLLTLTPARLDANNTDRLRIQSLN